jgi:hypothetical protein
MYNQVIIGRPKKCINRNCKTPFFKESLYGYMPKSSTEIFCLMRCSGCGDVFAIIQPVSIVKSYLNKLPSKPKTNRKNITNITIGEVEDIKKTMEEKNILSLLNDEPYNF